MIRRVVLLSLYFGFTPLLWAMNMDARLESGNGDGSIGSLIAEHGVSTAVLVAILGVGVWVLKQMVPHWIRESQARADAADALRGVPKAVEDLHEDVRELATALRDSRRDEA